MTPIDEGGARRRAALVVLNGATATATRRALAWARRLDERPLTVAVDGGLATLERICRRPDLMVGDGDSSSRWPRGVERLRLPRDKDVSDFGAALDRLADRADVAIVAGLLGGRVDHEWANVAEAGARAAAFELIAAPTARGEVAVTARGVVLPAARGREFSIFALGGPARVTVEGARWDLREADLAPGSRGLSNRGRRARVRVRVHRGAVAVVAPA